MLLQLSIFCLLYSPLPCTPFPPAFPHLSSCPWVIHISSLASPFPILFLTSSCLFCTYYLCFFPPFSPSTLYPPLPPSFPHLSSCLWVIHISSLASPFPILFLTSLIQVLYQIYDLQIFVSIFCPSLFWWWYHLKHKSFTF